MAKPTIVLFDQFSKVINSLKGKIKANKTSIDDINTKIGTVPENMTLTEYITNRCEGLSNKVDTVTDTINDNKIAIENINDETTGILANAKKYTDDKIGTLEEGKTVAETIEDAKYDDTALADNVAANKEAIRILNENNSVPGSISFKIEEKLESVNREIDSINKKAQLYNELTSQNATAIVTLNGEGEGSIKKSIDDAFNDFATKVSDDNVVNTYKELIDYAASHSAEFTELVGVVDSIKTTVGEGYTIATSDQITALLADD